MELNIVWSSYVQTIPKIPMSNEFTPEQLNEVMRQQGTTPAEQPSLLNRAKAAYPKVKAIATALANPPAPQIMEINPLKQDQA